MTMYNSRPSSNSPYSRSPETGNSGKYPNKSIGTATKSANGMTVVRGNKGVGKAIGGAAAPTATVAPIPINTPSVKRENNGRDPSVNLVPAATRTSNSGVWGQNSSGNDDSPSDNRATSQQPTPTVSTFSKPAPWAKPASRDAGGSAESVEALPPPPLRAPVTNWAEDVESDEDEDSSAAVPQSRAPHTDRPFTSAPQFSRPSEADQRMRKDRSGSGSFGGDNYHDDGGRYGRGASGDARYSGSNYQNDYGRSSGNIGGYSNSSNYGGISGPGSYRNAPNRGGGPDRSFGHMQQGTSSYGSGKFDSSLSAEQRAIEEARQEAELLEAKKLRKRTMSSEGAAAVGYSGEAQGGAGMLKRPEDSYEDRHSASRYQQGGYDSYSGYGNERRDYGRGSNSNRGREDYPSSGAGTGYAYGGMGSSGARIPHRTRGPSFDHEPSAVSASEPSWERVKRPEPPVPSAQVRSTGLAITSPYTVPAPSLQQMSLPPSLHMNASNPSQQQTDAMRVKRTRGPTTPRESSEEVSRNTAADPSKSYSSLFERKEQQNAQESTEIPQQHVQFLHKPQSDPTQRVGPPQSTPPESRRKMLFDPQSNAFRELGATDKPSTAYSRKADQDRGDRRAGPPAVEGADTTRRTMQVQRIEQNTGEKWARQTITKPAGGSRIVPPEAETSTTVAVEDDHDTESVREDEKEARRAARTKERAERGPRTKGFLFHYNAEGEIERVYTPEEKVRADALKQRKQEKAERDRKLTGLVDVAVEELPLHLPIEQFKALTVEQKQQLKERQIAARDSTHKTHTIVAPPAAKNFDPSVEFSSEEYRALSKEQKEQVKAHQIEQKDSRRAARVQKTAEKRSGAERTAAVSELERPQTTISVVESRSLASGELDIQKVALETEASRSKQPVKAFVPGQSYQTQSLAEPNAWDSAGLDAAHSHWDELSNRGYAGDLAVSAPQPMYTNDSTNNWSSYKSFPGAPEPALFGGNTSFLGNQETSLGSRFAALASGRQGDSEEEEYEDVEEVVGQEEQEEERSSARRFSRGGRGERAERSGRGRGRGYSGRSSRSGPPAVPADSDLAAATQRGYRESAAGRTTGRSSGRGGRESSRADATEPYTSQYSSTGRGRGSSRGRGSGRGDGEVVGERPSRYSGSAGRSTDRVEGRGDGRTSSYRSRTAPTAAASTA